jgi:hypothetical protein
MRRAAVAVALALGLVACAVDTARLTPVLERRFTVEGAVRRADVVSRHAHDAGTRSAGWEERLASIVVARRTAYIHKNQKVGLEITPDARRVYDVALDGDRVRIGAGGGKSRAVRSFVPPGTPPAGPPTSGA